MSRPRLRRTAGLSGLRPVLVLTVALLPATSRAATYYVAPWGDDAASGTAADPWRSPAVAVSRLGPGDTLVLRGGTYLLSDFERDVLRPPSGTEEAWIVIRGQEGERAVLAGRDDLALAVDLSGVSYLRLENLEITHDPTATGEAAWFRDGIAAPAGPVSHVVLENLHIHHLDEFGIDIADARDLSVIGSTIEYCGFGAIGGPRGRYGGFRGLVVRRCSLSWSGHYYRGGDGTDRPYDRPDGLGIEPSDGPVLVEDTVVSHNAGDGLDSKARSTTVRRCIVANNAADGVKLWGSGSRVENTLIYGRGDGDPTVTPWAPVVIAAGEAGATFELVNVTVDDQLGHNYLLYAQYDEPVPVAVTIRNSIFRCAGTDCPLWFRGTVSLVLDHDLFYLPGSPTVLIHGDTAYTAGSLAGLGPGILYGDPLFAGPAWGTDGDYHLREGSPAIDAGTPDGAPADDLEGNARDSAPDLGAYEYRAAGCTLSCSPSVPATAEVGVPATFRAGVEAHGCSGPPTVLWRFGDGFSSSEPVTRHAYTAEGVFRWTLTATGGGTSCGAAGEIAVGAGSGRSHLYLVPAVAHNPGLGGTNWRTDLALVATGDTPAEVELRFAGTSASIARSLVLEPGGTRVWPDVLETLFGTPPESSDQGVITVVSSAPLAVAGRTFNDTGHGSYGQFVPGLTAGDGLGAGEPGYLPLLRSDPNARTNLGVVNLGGDPIRVTVVLVGEHGETLGSPLVISVPPAGWRQIVDVFAAAGAGSTAAAYALLRLEGTDGRFWAYGSVVDSRTGDAVTVPVIPAAGAGS